MEILSWGDYRKVLLEPRAHLEKSRDIITTARASLTWAAREAPDAAERANCFSRESQFEVQYLPESSQLPVIPVLGHLPPSAAKGTHTHVHTRDFK